ncbi:MAG: MmgE/PrpD family protein [Candidatus Bathyarchaeota archaeon]|nr:MAG: MmgE/PrpD family protein [Candidatus Bathyarchaeota archaeon]
MREIRIYAGPNILEPLRYKQPINGLQAKFSLQFGMACILLKRRAGLREYTTAVVKSREISETMSKIKTFLSDEVAKMGTDKMRSIIELELHNKQIVRKFVETVRGMPETPIKNSELVTKFIECASFVLKENKINQILEIIRDLENKSSIKPLISLLSASACIRE